MKKNTTKNTAAVATKKNRGAEIIIKRFVNGKALKQITVYGKSNLWKAQGEFFNGHADSLDNCRMETWINGELWQNRQGKLVAGKVTSFLIKAEEPKAEAEEATEFTLNEEAAEVAPAAEA